MPPPDVTVGDREIHPTHLNLLRYFEYKHLPEHLQPRSAQFHQLAWFVALNTTRDDGSPADGPEITTALRKLLEAKDCYVRAHVPA